MKNYLYGALLGVLLLLMSNKLIGNGYTHESLGLLLLVLIGLHLWQNRYWTRALLIRPIPLKNRIHTLLNIALISGVIIAIISGLLIARYLFDTHALVQYSATARIIHHYSTYWVFTLMALHVGFHTTTLVARSQILIHRLAKYLLTTIALYGAYTFWQEGIYKYLFLQAEFTFFDFNQSALFFIFNYLSVFIFISTIGYLLFRAMPKQR